MVNITMPISRKLGIPREELRSGYWLPYGTYHTILGALDFKCMVRASPVSPKASGPKPFRIQRLSTQTPCLRTTHEFEEGDASGSQPLPYQSRTFKKHI